jgi:hypothetical protein
MNDLTNAQRENNKEILATDHVLNAHEFLLRFLAKFDTAKRGGIHDFMEIAMFNMLNEAIKSIDFYLISGHKSVSANELMSIFAESCQKILDNIKRNLEQMGQVNLR